MIKCFLYEKHKTKEEYLSSHVRWHAIYRFHSTNTFIIADRLVD